MADDSARKRIEEFGYVPAAHTGQETEMTAYQYTIARMGTRRQKVFDCIGQGGDDGILRKDLYADPRFADMKVRTRNQALTSIVWQLKQIDPPVITDGPDKRGVPCPGRVLRVVRR